MVELYLPDYLGKLMPQVRANRGRAWMIANWGYEESKHSMALADWLLHSGQRTEEQMADMEGAVFANEWQLPHDNARAMVCYTMFQELATWLNYHNLRKMVDDRDLALDRVLQLLSIDERAHYDFFRKLVQVYLEYDRPGTLEQLRRVVNTFKMPAMHLFVDGTRRCAAGQGAAPLRRGHVRLPGLRAGAGGVGRAQVGAAPPQLATRVGHDRPEGVIRKAPRPRTPGRGESDPQALSWHPPPATRSSRAWA